MKYISVCSGIEAASVAWQPLGWHPQFFSEIEPFPSAVLSHRHPNTPNLGDMTKFNDWNHYDTDILVGGTPCQSFSIAGLRKGLADPRGNLMLTYLAIAAKFRPRWLVWENVPGVLSSNGGKDFGTFLGGLAELGYGFAYRILDAQYVRVESHARAVPQRRRRVFVIGCLGDWHRAAAVLFERESLRWNTPPRRESRERVAATLSSRTKGGGGLGTDFDCDGGIVGTFQETGHGWRNDDPVAHSLRGDGFDASEDGTGRGTPLVPIAFSCKDHGADAGEIAPTLRGMSHDGSHPNGGGQVAIAFAHQAGGIQTSLGFDLDAGTVMTLGANQTPAVCFQARIGRNGRGRPEEVCSALNGSDAGETSDMRPCVALDLRNALRDADKRDAVNRQGCGIGDDCAHTLSVGAEHGVSHGFAVRRLVPRECERLQGFPDDYTAIPWGRKAGSECPDGPRYKALGNSMAVNVMRWLGERIASVEEIPCA